MVLPLKIQITEHEATLTAAVVPYGVSMVTPLDFAFLVHVDGEELVMSPYEFACHDAACRPPGKNGGTGGSRKKGSASGGAAGDSESPTGTAGGQAGTIGGGHKHKVGADSQDEDIRSLIGGGKKQFLNNHVNEDGTLGVPYTKAGGAGTVEFDATRQKQVDKQLKTLGVKHEDLVDNLVNDALGAIEMPGAKAAMKWYDTEHKWGTGLSEKYDVDLDRIFGATALLSAMRKWGGEGTGTNLPSTNKGAVERILKLLHEDKPFKVTAEMAKNFNEYVSKKVHLGKGTLIKEGMYRPSDLSSSSLSRLVGANGLDLKIMNLAGSKPIARTIALLRGEVTVNQIVRGSKQRSFVSNLTHPDIDYTSTNDLWHFRAIAGKLNFNFPDRRKGDDWTTPLAAEGSRVRTTLEKFENHITGHKIDKETGVKTPVRANQPHAIFSGSEPHGGLYSYVTKVTREALDRLQATDVRFKKMRIHEFQALIWKYAGGNAAGSNDEGSDE